MDVENCELPCRKIPAEKYFTCEITIKYFITFADNSRNHITE